MNRKTSLVRSTLILLTLGVVSFGVGYYASNIFSREELSTTGKPVQSKVPAQNKNDWPEVQWLASSGIEPISEASQEACRKSLEFGNEQNAPAHSDNYGNRDTKDALGRKIPNKPALIVLHETVISAPETVNFFKTPHPNDNDQASYHMLVNQKGDLVRIVPDSNRAYGSGYSRFGDFTVQSKSAKLFSVNNVALHISLETPPDGRGNASSHSGYTRDQYNSLAKQVLLWQAKYGIPIFRVTTHASVDRSHSRYDPRTFRWDSFDFYHRQHAATCGLSNLTLS
jgi:N-acetyl-anhydromuramyl-L-alanine amidase AmpD